MGKKVSISADVVPIGSWHADTIVLEDMGVMGDREANAFRFREVIGANR
jgi:hypothetical protein